MNHLGPEDRALLEASVTRFVEDRPPGEHAEHDHWLSFAELGWLALPLSEQSGGLGGSPKDVQVLAKGFGQGLIKSPFIESAVLSARVLDELEPGSERLQQIAAGAQILILAHDEFGSDFSFDRVDCSVTQSGGQWSLSGTKTMVAHTDVAHGFLVTAMLDGEPLLLCLSKDSAGLSQEEYPTIDGRLAADLHFNSMMVDESQVVARGDVVESALEKAGLFTICCLAAELEGIAEQARVLTAEYLNTREQFGGKLADFQALQHTFADMVMTEEELRGIAWMTGSAWEIEDESERESMLRASKARMGAIARPMLESAVQLHGGVGVSEEFVIGAYLRRTIAIDAMLGDSGQHTRWQSKQYLGAVS